jgi:hypothetical protein
MTPIHPIVEALLTRLDPNLREAFEERAGIMQFEAGHPRELAEALAMLEVVRTHPLAVSGLSHVRARVKGQEFSVLVAHADLDNNRIASMEILPSPQKGLLEVVQQLGRVVVLRQFPNG